MADVCKSSVKIYVPEADVARTMRSFRNLGEGDFVEMASMMKGCRAASAFGCAWSMV